MSSLQQDAVRQITVPQVWQIGQLLILHTVDLLSISYIVFKNVVEMGFMGDSVESLIISS